jgi:hypothetical protein
MKTLRFLLPAALLFFGCARNYPEGVYPCTLPADCPSNWFCHTDRLCWSHPETDAAMSGTDAGPMPDVGPNDVGARDAFACTPAAETCNDADDDCDGMIDEDLAIVGAPVMADPALNAQRINMVAGGDHFILVSSVSERLIGRTGDPSGQLLLGLGQGLQPDALAHDGSRLLVGQWQGPLAAYEGPMWTTPYAAGATLLLDASPTRVTAYTMGRRSRLDTSPSTGPTEIRFQTIGTGSTDGTNWAGVRAGNDELVLFGLHLWQTTSGDGTTPHDLGFVSAGDGDMTSVAMAVRDPFADVGPNNPVAVVYLQRGSTELGTHFLEITSLRPFAMSAPHVLFGSTDTPIWPGEYEEPFVTVIAAPGGDRETNPGHWYVVTNEFTNDPSGMAFTNAELHAWELSSTHREGRPITIPQNGPSFATSIAMAASGGVIRVASESPVGLATRSVGCH